MMLQETNRLSLFALMQKHFNKRLVTEDPSCPSHEISSYAEDSSELQDDIDEHAAFRRKILRDPHFFKQLTLSFYSQKDTPVEPSPRVIQKVVEIEVQRTPTPKDNNNVQVGGAKQFQKPFLSPSQKQRSPNFAVQHQGLDKGGRVTPNNLRKENAVNENFNSTNRQAVPSSNINEKSSDKPDPSNCKQVTPKTFKISTVTGIDMKRALFQIPSPVLKRELGKSKSPVVKVDHIPTYNSKLNSALSSGAVSVVPSTGTTTPKYVESFVNAPISHRERDRLQQAKTLKMPTSKGQLKIKIPGQEEIAPAHVNVKNLVHQSIRNGKITSPVSFKNHETSVGSKTVMSKQYLSPSRPNIPGTGTGHQFRAGRMLFQKENKAPEPEHQQEKLFEKYFEQSEAVDFRISTMKKGRI